MGINILADYALNQFQARDIAMLKLINPIADLLSSSRAFQLIVVLGIAASVTAALIGSASALPPDPCDIFFGF